MSGVIFDPRFRVASANPTLPKIVDGHLAASYTTTRDTTRLRVIAPHVAYVRGDFSVTKAAPLDCGHFIALLREQAKVWRVVTYHETGATCPAVH